MGYLKRQETNFAMDSPTGIVNVALLPGTLATDFALRLRSRSDSAFQFLPHSAVRPFPVISSINYIPGSRIICSHNALHFLQNRLGIECIA